MARRCRPRRPPGRRAGDVPGRPRRLRGQRVVARERPGRVRDDPARGARGLTARPGRAPRLSGGRRGRGSPGRGRRRSTGTPPPSAGDDLAAPVVDDVPRGVAGQGQPCHDETDARVDGERHHSEGPVAEECGRLGERRSCCAARDADPEQHERGEPDAGPPGNARHLARDHDERGAEDAHPGDPGASERCCGHVAERGRAHADRQGGAVGHADREQQDGDAEAERGGPAGHDGPGGARPAARPRARLGARLGARPRVVPERGPVVCRAVRGVLMTSSSLVAVAVGRPRSPGRTSLTLGRGTPRGIVDGVWIRGPDVGNPG